MSCTDLQMTEGRPVWEFGVTAMIPFVRIVSPDLNGNGNVTWRTPITLTLPVESVRKRTGSPSLSLTITCPVRSKLSSALCENSLLATSAQLVQSTANMAHMKFMGALCQIGGIFSSVNG
jgi:hypothetical protein